MIYIYAMFISVLLICECGAAIAAFMLKSDLKDVMQKKFKDGMQNYGKFSSYFAYSKDGVFYILLSDILEYRMDYRYTIYTSTKPIRAHIVIAILIFNDLVSP